MARVELDGVAKRYPNGFQAVKGVDLDVADGEFIVLVGPSGCGKSTTLRMVAGLESITDGELRIDGARVNDVAPRDRDVAMVFQSYALYPHMTVFENMAFALKLRKTPPAEIKQRVEAVAEQLDITALLDRRPAQMSGGQRQRVAMGRAIVRRPRVFLFDEPLSNLDAKLRLKMRIEVARLHRALGATSLYVTHDQVEAMTLADRIVLMKDGDVQQIGAPLDLYHRPATVFVATFIGSPTMNIIAASVAGGRLVGGGLDAPLPAGAAPATGQALQVGVRPVDVRVAEAGEAPMLRGVVEVVEPMGNESFVHCRVADELIVLREEGESRRQAGEAVALVVTPERLHLFDAATGRRL
ncbi:MAG: sn-glycerol-3-phosphate ABC transporter ATP-binding protein UgpC [Myxococcales bacterium]|nr:sn-glycerol-3-phosphate ABC transporter ATP-binding protein UgpC [Myxococcales bacterium]